MARSTTVITSIINAGKLTDNVFISTVSWSVDHGDVTLTAAVSSSINVGDILYDSASNGYVITAISDTVLTCQDFSIAGLSPAVGTASVDEAYQSITDWEADLDDTIIYVAGDVAVGEMYSDGGAFVESNTINGGITVGLSEVILTVPESERHDGTAGTGVLKQSSGGSITTTLGVPGRIEWLECDANGFNAGPLLVTNYNTTTATDIILRNCLLHDLTWSNSNHNFAVGWIIFGGSCTIQNCIVYNIFSAGIRPAIGIGGPNTSPSMTRPLNVYNCTVYNISGSTGGAYGFRNTADDADTTVRNVIAMKVEAPLGNAQCFEPDISNNATMTNNMSSDSTASGSGAITNATSSLQFVSIIDGSIDLHLVSDSQAIDSGFDLGNSNFVNFDINNRDRDALGDIWDIGSHEFVETFIPRVLRTEKNIFGRKLIFAGRTT